MNIYSKFHATPISKISSPLLLLERIVKKTKTCLNYTVKQQQNNTRNTSIPKYSNFNSPILKQD